MIEVDECFVVPATARLVWGVLADPHVVVGCVPGAALLDEHEDGSFDASLTTKFGPMNIAFRALVTLELDHATMRGRLTAQGKDKLGGVNFHANATFGVVEQRAGRSEVATHGMVDISGRLASLIEGGAGIASKRTFAEFAQRLAERCARAAQGGRAEERA